MLEITWDLAGWNPARITSEQVRSAARAGSEALRAMRAESSRRIRERKRFKVAKLNRALALQFPTSKKSLGDLIWRMNVSGKPVPLIDFPHTSTRKGVTVSVNVGSRKLIKSAFIAVMKSGHQGIFVRVGKKRLPIREAYTTTVADAMRDQVRPALGRAQSVFERAFARLEK